MFVQIIQGQVDDASAVHARKAARESHRQNVTGARRGVIVREDETGIVLSEEPGGLGETDAVSPAERWIAARPRPRSPQWRLCRCQA